VKVAVPTDNGVRISPRFGRASSFVVADVGLGAIRHRERRPNPASSRTRETLSRRKHGVRPERHHAVVGLLSDCRAVLALSIGERMREFLERRGIEVILTSETLIDRALALFALASLRDETRIVPDEEDLDLGLPFEEWAPDEFDG